MADNIPPENQLLPYAGRWVATLRGKVIAQGSTPDSALAAALTIRPKDRSRIQIMPVSPNLQTITKAVLEALPPGQTIHLVGGAVRDMLMQRNTHDLDFVVPSGALKVARQVANKLGGAYFALDAENDTGRVILTSQDGLRDVLDFASYRGVDLESDLFARDFTINAIAFDLRAEKIIDPTGGATDIREKRLKACSDNSFTNDPIRTMRAVRLAATLGFHIATETRQLIKQAASLLPRVSYERIRDELFKILDGPQPATSIRALDILGILPYVLPELPALKGVKQSPPHVHQVWEHTLRVLDYLESIFSVLAPGYDADSTNDLYTGLLTLRIGRYREQFAEHFAKSPENERSPRAILMFAALYHDIAKPLTMKIEGERIRFLRHEEIGAEVAEKRAQALRLSNDEILRIKTIIREHMRIHFHTDRLLVEKIEPTRRAIYRFFNDTGQFGVDLCLIAMADKRATYDHTLPQETWTACLDVCRIFLENYWEKREEVVSPPQLLNGTDLMTTFKLKAGPQIGALLEAIRESQATGHIHTREEALLFARGWLVNENSHHEKS